MAAPKQTAFMVSSATVMIDKFGDTPVFDLTPSDHSVGIAKEFNVTVDGSNLDLLNGVAQVVVDTVRTGVQTGITGSVYEYSAQNILYALGLGSQTPATVARGKLSAEAAGGAASLSVVSDPVPGDSATAIAESAGAIAKDATLIIQHPTNPALVFTTRASAASTFSTPTHTVAVADPYDIPSGMTFPIGSKVWVATEAAVGSMADTDLFSVKITGTLSKFSRPVVILAPKVQIIRGFNLSFTETEYGSMPWEMRPMLLSAGEATGRLAEIGTEAPCRIILP